MFSKTVPYFGMWAERSQDRQDRAAAFAVLKAAASACHDQDVRTPEVLGALSALESRALRHGPFRQFRAALNFPDPDARDQATRKALAAIARGLGIA